MNAPWPHGDPRAVAASIVADSRFRGTTASTPPEKSLLDIALAWVRDRLHELFQTVGHALGAHAALDAAIVVAVGLAIAAALALLIVRFVRLPGRTHGAARPAPVRVAVGATSAELIAHALEAARAERWQAAASALARAAFCALDETGRLRFDPARTPGEARRLLRDPAFDAFEREATRALFAENAATAEQFARLRATYAGAFGVNV